jgi:translation initiation factor IF-2
LQDCLPRTLRTSDGEITAVPVISWRFLRLGQRPTPRWFVLAESGQLKRFKDDVREVAKGYECGTAVANYNDIREGFVIECFESEVVPA